MDKAPYTLVFLACTRSSSQTLPLDLWTEQGLIKARGAANLGLMGDLGFEGELGVWLALVGGGEEVGPGDPPAQGQGCLHQHLQGNQNSPKKTMIPALVS